MPICQRHLHTDCFRHLLVLMPVQSWQRQLSVSDGRFWLTTSTKLWACMQFANAVRLQGNCRPAALKMYQKARQEQVLPSAAASPFVHQQPFAAAWQSMILVSMVTPTSSRLQCNTAALAFRQLTLLSCEMSTYTLRPGCSKFLASSACSLILIRKFGGCSAAASKAGCIAEACVGEINSGTILRAMLPSPAGATQQFAARLQGFQSVTQAQWHDAKALVCFREMLAARAAPVSGFGLWGSAAWQASALSFENFPLVRRTKLQLVACHAIALRAILASMHHTCASIALFFCVNILAENTYLNQSASVSSSVSMCSISKR